MEQQDPKKPKKGLAIMGSLKLPEGRPVNLTVDIPRRLDPKNVVKLPGKENELGGGESAYVFLAKFQDMKIALKEVVLSSPQDVDKLNRECEILHRCSNPYIVKYYGSFQIGHVISHAIEYMDRKSLDQYVQFQPGSSILAHVTNSVLKGLDYLLFENIMHRDVKPSNITVNQNGDIKLCDFGISREIAPSGQQMTHVGSWRYLGPERFDSNKPEYNWQSDVWSLGITLIELANGVHPYPQPIQYLVIKEIQNPNYSPTYLRSDFPDSAHDFLAQCVQRESQRRPSFATLLAHSWIQTQVTKEEFANWLKEHWQA